jgi:hypothetical protein
MDEIISAVYDLFHENPGDDFRHNALNKVDREQQALYGELYSFLTDIVPIDEVPDELSVLFQAIRKPELGLMMRAPLTGTSLGIFKKATMEWLPEWRVAAAIAVIAALQFELGDQARYLPAVPAWQASIDVFIVNYAIYHSTSSHRGKFGLLQKQLSEELQALQEGSHPLFNLREKFTAQEQLILELQDGARNGIESFVGETNTSIENARQSFAKMISETEVNLATVSEQLRDATKAAKAASEKAAYLESRSDELAGLINAKSADMEEKFGAADIKAQAFMDSVRAKADFEDLKIHWVDRASSARWALNASWAVLLILLVVVPIAAVYESTTILQFAKQFTDAATVDIGADPSAIAIAVSTLSRLIIIAVPLAFYFWLIRLVVRFNMRSMLLMDDARQRATMLETYYKMIERSAATVKDRALVLQALMRPAPGHGPDTFEPPNFTEVIDKAMGKG